MFGHFHGNISYLSVDAKWTAWLLWIFGFMILLYIVWAFSWKLKGFYGLIPSGMHVSYRVMVL